MLGNGHYVLGAERNTDRQTHTHTHTHTKEFNGDYSNTHETKTHFLAL